MRIAFLVNALGLFGGITVIVAHASELQHRHGFDVSLVLTSEQPSAQWRHPALNDVTVTSLERARSECYDVAISTWWETAFSLFELRAQRYASFVQSLEERLYPRRAPERIAARLTLDLPVSFITEARWIVASWPTGARTLLAAWSPMASTWRCLHRRRTSSRSSTARSA